MTVVLVNERYDPYWVHPLFHPLTCEYVRSDLCLGRNCSIDHRANLTRWCAFIAGARPGSWESVVVCLSVEAARSLGGLWSGKTGFRGRKVTFERTGKAYNGLVVVRREPTDYYPQLPAVFDTGPSLRLIWRLPAHPRALVDYSAEQQRGPS